MRRPDHSAAARLSAGVIAGIALASVALQWWDRVATDGLSPVAALWDLTFFFTILTTLLVAWTLGRLAFTSARPAAAWLGALTVAIVLVAIVYHLLLRGLRDLSVMGQIADWGLHTVGPLLLVLWWLRFSPRGALWFTDLPALLAWPALYVAYALTRGGMAGRFPYPFLDPNALGWGTVLINIAELAGATVFGALVLIGIDRFRGR